MVRMGFIVLLGLVGAASAAEAWQPPKPGQSWEVANPRGAGVAAPARAPQVTKLSRRELVLRRALQKERTRKVLKNLRRELRKEQAIRSRESLADLVEGETPPQEAPQEAPPLLELSDEALAGKLGLNTTTGEQSNAANRIAEIEIDTWAGWLQRHSDVKVGPSLVLARRGKLKGSLDVADSFIGLSANYELKPVIRPSIGGGLGYQTDSSDWTAYVAARFGVW